MASNNPGEERDILLASDADTCPIVIIWIMSLCILWTQGAVKLNKSVQGTQRYFHNPVALLLVYQGKLKLTARYSHRFIKD